MTDIPEEVLNQPQTVSAEELHALLLSLKEDSAAQKAENADLRKKLEELEAQKVKEEQGTAGMPGGAPVAHHLHLIDGRVVTNHEGIGTHYSETLEDGTERITRIANHYPVEEIHPSKAYA